MTPTSNKTSIILNFSKLGYRYFRMIFDCHSKDKSAILTGLTEHPSTCWVMEGAGFGNLAIGVWARNNSDINNISEQIRKIAGPENKLLLQSELTSLFAFYTKDNERFSGCMLDADTMPVSLTPLEMDYLKTVSVGNDMSMEDVAKILHIETQEAENIKVRLEKLGVIVGYQPVTTQQGHYYKLFVDSSTLDQNLTLEKVMNELWQDPHCIYFEKANSKYNIEFELLLPSKELLVQYTSKFKDFQVILFENDFYTNLYPLNKTANLKEIHNKLQDQAGSEVIDLRSSKLWYLNYDSANAYMDIFERNKEYSKTMMGAETDLFPEITNFIKERLPAQTYTVIDLGSGNGVKANLFMEALDESKVKAYYPTDIQPIELDIAERNNLGKSYPIHKTLINFENLKSLFPLPTLPEEKQVYVFFGGTYGNFSSQEINSYLKPLLNKDALICISMPIIIERMSEEEVLDSYTNKSIEDMGFGALKQLGFKLEDFKSNKKRPDLKLTYVMEDKRVVCMFELEKDIDAGGDTYKSGTRFKIMTSWKPTLQEFKDALDQDFSILNIFSNDEMAIAVIANK